MGNALELASIYDEWVKTLDPRQKEWCHRALRNAAVLENVGEVSAKELIIFVLLFCAGNAKVFHVGQKTER
jgi:hypothetical protein